MVWDTLLVPMDTAVLDTAATTLARERLRLSQRPNPRLMLMPGMVHTVWDTLDSMVDMGWDTEAMVDTVWDTAPMNILVMLDMDTEATDMDVDTATGVEREVICYERSRLTDY